MEIGKESETRRKPALLGLVLLILVSGIYAVSLGGEFVYDDILLIQKEEAPDDPGDWARIFAEPTNPFCPYYRPLSRLSYLARKAVHGNAPLWFHAANVLLAGLIAFTAFRLLLRPQFSLSPAAAFLGAAVFTLHPVSSSSVLPIFGRKTSLAVLLMVASLNAYLHAGARWRILSIALWAAAVLSKEQALILVVIFALVVACAVFTVHRATTFRTNEEFCRQWVRTSSRHYLAHCNLARALEDGGKYGEAAGHYATAMEFNPDWAPAYVNLGAMHLRHADFEGALALPGQHLHCEYEFKITARLFAQPNCCLRSRDY